MQSNDVYTSARKGILPPGINTKTWLDDDNSWAYAMSVYVPSLTDAAAQTGKEMKESKIVQPIRDGGVGKGSESRTGFTDEKDTRIKGPAKDEKPGPTGKVGKDKDL